MGLDYDKCKKWGKLLTFISCGVLIIISIARFFNIIFKNPIDYIVIIYMILLGAIFILCEIPIQIVLDQFNFLQYYYGKAGMSLFLGLLSFNKHHWFTILNAIVMWVVCILYIILSVMFYQEEKGGATSTVAPPQPQPNREVKISNIQDQEAKV